MVHIVIVNVQTFIIHILFFCDSFSHLVRHIYIYCNVRFTHISHRKTTICIFLKDWYQTWVSNNLYSIKPTWYKVWETTSSKKTWYDNRICWLMQNVTKYQHVLRPNVSFTWRLVFSNVFSSHIIIIFLSVVKTCFVDQWWKKTNHKRKLRVQYSYD